MAKRRRGCNEEKAEPKFYAGTWFEAFGVPDPAVGSVSWGNASVDLNEWFEANGYPPADLVLQEARKMERKPIERDLFSDD